VEGGERLRLFLALPLPDEPSGRFVRWQAAALEGAADARPVSAGNLHVTLAFLGGRPAGEVPGIVEEMHAAARAGARPLLRAVRYRETRSVGMVVFSDEEGRATALANDLFTRLERLGVYERERRPWLPHVTVLRFRRRPGLRPDPPDLGEVGPSEVALYNSVLRRTGAQYQILESAPLGG
jgi:RNA 2',3'-cyclic 3'-phosphodiesterase